MGFRKILSGAVATADDIYDAVRNRIRSGAGGRQLYRRNPFPECKRNRKQQHV